MDIRVTKFIVPDKADLIGKYVRHTKTLVVISVTDERGYTRELRFYHNGRQYNKRQFILDSFYEANRDDIHQAIGGNLEAE